MDPTPFHPSQQGSPSPRHPPTQATSCLDRFTNYWDATENYVFFNAPDEPDFNFTIITKFLKFYPGTLAHLLEAYKFRIVNASSIPDSELCGWIGAGYVEVDQHIRGTVGWKYSDLGRKTDTPNFGNTSWVAVSRQHVPPYTTPKPTDKTLTKIKTILKNNAPDADIYYSTTLVLGAACGTLGFAIVFYGLLLYSEMERRTKAARSREACEGSEDVELDQIKVHNLSGLGMQRMDSQDASNTRRFEMGVTKPEAPSSVRMPRSRVTDPPPIYSVDGAGR